MVHLFLQSAYDRCEGIGVDVHVHRIAQRLKWVPSTAKGPEDTRKALESWLPKEYWDDINGMLVGFGQTVCTPRNPKCNACDVSGMCPSAFAESNNAKRSRNDMEDIGHQETPARTTSKAKKGALSSS